jgi:hypothetical protein
MATAQSSWVLFVSMNEYLFFVPKDTATEPSLL